VLADGTKMNVEEMGAHVAETCSLIYLSNK